MNFEQIEKSNAEKNVKNIFELDPDTERFGGVQKFVLLKFSDEYFLGSLPGVSHTEILTSMTANKDDVEVLGGGMFTFFNNKITLEDSFSSKLGPIQVKQAELVEIMKTAIRGKYEIVLGE
ncbi:MAG: hypothetical protein EOM88_03370 [Clostridia bacterium]|nr:hypothetical protein [Clostridia bacterium]